MNDEDDPTAEEIAEGEAHAREMSPEELAAATKAHEAVHVMAEKILVGVAIMNTTKLALTGTGFCVHDVMRALEMAASVYRRLARDQGMTRESVQRLRRAASTCGGLLHAKIMGEPVQPEPSVAEGAEHVHPNVRGVGEA